MLQKLFSGLIVVSGLSIFAWGYISFEKFNFTAGPQVQAAAVYPEQASGEFLSKDLPSLFVFIHPKCACTRATLSEIGKVVEAVHNKLAVRVFYNSDVRDEEAEKAVLSKLAGVQHLEIHQDASGKLADTFGAKTSGQTYLYSKAAHLLFQGGVTASRGHEGENEGSRAIKYFVESESLSNQQASLAPTFGCTL